MAGDIWLYAAFMFTSEIGKIQPSTQSKSLERLVGLDFWLGNACGNSRHAGETKRCCFGILLLSELIRWKLFSEGKRSQVYCRLERSTTIGTELFD